VKRRLAILNEFYKHPFFNKENFKIEVERFGLSRHSVDAYLKSNDIFKLKRSFYINKNRFKEDKGDLSYIFYIANNLRSPSYISLESAMQFYNLTTELVASIVTSVTNKVTRTYNTELGKFMYRSIKDDLFDYFETYTKGKYKFIIATNFKSIFDYLYFITNRFRKKIDNTIFDLLRIDINELSLKDKKFFNKLIKNYTNSEVKI
jgi:hypothetical protein